MYGYKLENMFKCHIFYSESDDISLKCLKFSLLKKYAFLVSLKIDTYHKLFVRVQCRASPLVFGGSAWTEYGWPGSQCWAS